MSRIADFALRLMNWGLFVSAIACLLVALVELVVAQRTGKAISLLWDSFFLFIFMAMIKLADNTARR